MPELDDIQNVIRQTGLDGWLLFDFRGSNPIAGRIAGLPAEAVFSRRWAYWIPAEGEPEWLVHAIEIAPFRGQPKPPRTYVRWQTLCSELQEMMGDARRIAMEYSPECAIPYVSRVDAGTIEMIRGLGKEIVSSADLVQVAEARWTPQQREGHCRSANALLHIKDETFDYVAFALRAGTPISEYSVQQWMMQRIDEAGLVVDHPPLVAVNAHAVYADITWVALCADQVPQRYQHICDVVARARDAAVAYVEREMAAGRVVRGCDVDDACRGVIEQAGYGPYFIHRTGHSLGTSGHGNGANMDNLETNDTRRLIPGTAFTIEPGIYLPGDFGVRLEIDLAVHENGVEITTLPLQHKIIALL